MPLQVPSIVITVACALALDARASALARFFILFLICIVRCPFVRPSLIFASRECQENVKSRAAAAACAVRS